MIFQHPIAWLGLAAIAVPILVHLLGRRRARRVKFPTLRFVPASPLPPVRRDRLTDVALLFVRAATIAAAVVALVQPLWLTPSRAREVGGTLSRAIVVDTSASMDRSSAERSLRSQLRTASLAQGGERAVDRARREAAALTTDATASRVIDATSPAAALPGALAWLGTQSGRTELVVISDFQPAAIERADLEGVPADTGVRLVAIPIAGDASAPAEAVTPLRLFAGSAEQRRADAALAAARQIHGEWKGRADRPIAIVFPGSPERAALVQSAQPIDRAWMFDAVDAIGRNATLTDAATVVPSTAGDDTALPRRSDAEAGLTVVTRTAGGRPLVLAARGQIDGIDRLLLFLQADAGSVPSAALIAAAAGAAAARPPASEIDPAFRAEAELRSWERPPGEGVRPATDPAGRSDGRWVWLAVLALLGVETLMRRAPRTVAAAPVPARQEHERVA